MTLEEILDWDSLLEVETISLDKERETSAQMAKYILDNQDKLEDTKNYKWLGDLKHKINYNKRNLNKFKNPYNQIWIEEMHSAKSINIYPGNQFPIIKNIEELFYLVNYFVHLTEDELNSCYITDSWFLHNTKDFTERIMDLVSCMVYFDFIRIINDSRSGKYVFTENVILLKNVSYKNRFIVFLGIISQCETVRELITVQYYSQFDNLTKEIMRDKLYENPSILEYKVDERAIKKIINNFRLWYLSISNFF